MLRRLLVRVQCNCDHYPIAVPVRHTVQSVDEEDARTRVSVTGHTATRDYHDYMVNALWRGFLSLSSRSASAGTSCL
jgi:hypothetical protein